MAKDERRRRLTEATRTILECLGENPDREGLLKTPLRYADALMFFTQGYEQSLTGISNCNLIVFILVCCLIMSSTGQWGGL